MTECASVNVRRAVHSSSGPGDLLIKTYYDVPAAVGEGDDPYVFLLGKDNVISND